MSKRISTNDIEKIVKKYSFLKLSKEEIETIIDKEFAKISKFSYDDVDMNKMIKKIMDNVVKNSLQNNDSSIETINSYINNKFVKVNDYNQSLVILKTIDNFLSSIKKLNEQIIKL